MLEILTQACISLLCDRQAFWLLAAVTDRSYEEGVRNRGFRTSVESYERVGLQGELAAMLRGGVNGNLKELLEVHPEVLPPVIRTMGKGQDLEFRARVGSSVRAEVKPIFDLTDPKYYPDVAADYDKLMAVRRAGWIGPLFLAVFFVQLPSYKYPPGTWYGRYCPYARVDYRGYRGINRQYDVLRRYLTAQPVWPLDRPYIQTLECSSNDTAASVLGHWLPTVFQPKTPWEFRAEDALRDAAVGVAI